MDIVEKIIKLNDIHKTEKILDNLPLSEILKVLTIFDKHYFENTAIISDTIYDFIVDYVKKKDKSLLLNKVGYRSSNSCKLPYYMGSENKTYTDDGKLFTWLNNYKTKYIIISAKADGISAMYDVINSKLLIRGDGNYGKDVTWLLKYINKINIDPNIYAIRGELIINKPKDRNTVSGIIHSKTLHADVSLIRFVAYEILNPRYAQDIQFEILSKNIETVMYTSCLSNDISYTMLQNIYEQYSNESSYYIDGLVLRNTNNNDLITKGNPPWSICYKPPDIQKIQKVIDIEWNISKYNKITPIVIISPVTINKRTITRINCYNTNYIIDNGIGIGSEILIEYKGGVIPKVVKVIKPVKVDISNIPDLCSKEASIKTMISFFRILKVKGVSRKIIEMLYDKEGIHNIVDMLKKTYTPTDKKSFNNFIEAINTIKALKLSLPLAISSLSIQYLSEKTVHKIYSSFPNFINEEPILHTISGINTKSANNIINALRNNRDYIIEFLNIMHIKYNYDLAKI